MYCFKDVINTPDPLRLLSASDVTISGHIEPRGALEVERKSGCGDPYGTWIQINKVAFGELNYKTNIIGRSRNQQRLCLI